MSESRGFSYAIVLAAAFLLWIPVALFGAGGYSALLALAAIPAIFLVRYRSFGWLSAAIIALVAWAALSGLWSAESDTIVSGDLAEGDFGINAAGLRIVLTALAGLLVIGASLRIRGPNRIALGLVLMFIAVHGICMLLMGIFPDTALSLYAPFSDPVREAPQNILRSTNAFFLVCPVLIGAAWMLPKPWRYLAAGTAFLLGFLTFLLVRSDVALLGSVLAALAIGVIFLFQQSGLRILLGIAAAGIIAAPVILPAAAPIVVHNELPLPSSTKSRIFAWSLAAKKVYERPLVGHGIEASKEWRETFADEPELLALMRQSTDLTDIPWEQYRILPGHPHNMGLQLWAETGLVGVVLACTVLLLLALALPPPAKLGMPVSIAAAGLIAATFSLFSLSYSLWNEAFWATVVLVAAAIVLLSRQKQDA